MPNYMLSIFKPNLEKFWSQNSTRKMCYENSPKFCCKWITAEIQFVRFEFTGEDFINVKLKCFGGLKGSKYKLYD